MDKRTMQEFETRIRARNDVVLSGEVSAPEGSTEIDFSFSSEEPVRRWFGTEILGHGPTDKVNLDRFLATGSVLMFHDHEQPVARPIRAYIDTDTKKGRVRAKFSAKEEESAEALNKIREEMIRGVSVGYSVEKFEVIAVDEDGYPTSIRATEWTVLEVSFVTVPADATVGIGRSLPSASTPGASPAHSRLGDKAMFKLKDGREVTLSELDALRLHGDVTLADGTTHRRSIPADVLEFVRGNTPAPTPAMIAATQGAKIVPVESDETIERSLFPEDAKCDAVEVKRRQDIRSYIAIGRKAAPAVFGVGAEERFYMRNVDGKLVTAEWVRLEVSRLIDEEHERTTGAKDDNGKSVIGAKDGKTPGTITGGVDNNVRSLMEAIPDSLLLRSRILSAQGEVINAPVGRDGSRPKVVIHERAHELQGLKLMQLVRCVVEAANPGMSTTRMTDRDILKIAGAGRGNRSMQGVADFSTALENTLNKAIIISYRNAGSTYRSVARVMAATDLRAHNLHSFGGVPSLARVTDNAEVTRASVPDSKKEIVTPYQHARIFAITDQAFINDDLGALTDLPQEFGRAADTTVNEHFWHMFLSASGVGPTMNEDSVALFDTSGHANYVTSGGAAPGATPFNVAFGAMMTKTGLNGKPLGSLTMPKIIAIPPSLRGVTIDFLSTEYLISGNGKSKNPYFEAVTPVIEPLLQLGVTLEGDNAPAAAAGDDAAWMLFADPNLFPTGVVAFYDGDMPKVEQNRPIDLIGTEYRVQLDFGVGVANWRGAYKNDGDA